MSALGPLSFVAWSFDLLRVPASWPVSLAVAGLVLAAALGVNALLFAGLSRVAALTQTELDDALLRRMRMPARLLAGLLGLHAFVIMRGGEHPLLRKGVLVVELLLAAYLAIESAETIVLHYWLGERQKIVLPAVVRHLLLAVLYGVAVLSVVGTVTGVDLLPVLATSTVVTVVLGLALQDTLGNLFAGLSLHSERAFGLDDWVMVDGVEGKVVSVGWRTTRLQTFSGDVVSLPNAVIARARVQNFSAPTRRCARNLELLVPLAASPEAVERAGERACAALPSVLEDPPVRVRLIGMTPLFQRYLIKIWIEDFQQHDDIESDVLKALWRACQEEGIALAQATPLPALEAGPAPGGAAVATVAALPGSPPAPPAPPTTPTVADA